MNQNQQKGSGDAAENRQYQYEEQKESKQQSVPNRTFQFSFGGKQDIPKKLKMPRSMNYIEAVQAADLLSANDEAIIAKLKEKMDEDAVDELSEMSAEELAKELMRSIREELSDTLNEMKECRLLGVLAKCYIDGCDVHAITSEGEILEHFHEGIPLPNGLDPGRRVFHQHPKCASVEVYTNYCLVVNNDGSVTQVSWE